jgi:hypothetical protein
MLWTTNNDMPPNHAPTATNIATAKTPPEVLVSSSAPMNHKPTTKWQTKSSSLGASISPDGRQVHNHVANQVPSLGATISPDG